MKRGGGKFRVEKDVMGSIKVPSDAYYGIQTVRAAKNFPISGLRIPKIMNDSLIEIKMAAAKANVECRVLDRKVGKFIVRACKEILREDYSDQFIIDVYQAGAGTPWHMNANEVIANVALKLMGKRKGSGEIDSHNHVNYGQSTNGVIPTAMRLASVKLVKLLVLEISDLISSLRRKGREFKMLVKTGRTHLQDAVPITLGQEFDAWASDIVKRLESIKIMERNLKSLHIGGTAIGTGFNAHPKFAKLVVKNLKKITGVDFVGARNKVEQTQFMGDFLDLSASLRNFAVDLNKIANDIRLLSSGPVTGLAELKLPEVEPGSSIMPGKFNPSMAEMMNMVCIQVIGNDEVLKEGANAGQLELNVMTPVIAYNLITGLEILRNGIKMFNDNCVKGIKANKQRLLAYFEKNPSIATILNPILGYDKTAGIVVEALKKDKSIKELVVEKKILSQKEADKIFDVKNVLGD